MATSATIGVEGQRELRELKEDKAYYIRQMHLAWDEIKALKKQVSYWKHKAKSLT